MKWKKKNQMIQLEQPTLVYNNTVATKLWSLCWSIKGRENLTCRKQLI